MMGSYYNGRNCGNYLVVDKRDDSIWGDGYDTRLKAREAILGYAMDSEIGYLEIVELSWWMGCH